MARFIGLFDIAHSHTSQFTVHRHTLVTPVMSSVVIAWYKLPMVDVPLPLSSQTVPGLSCWFLTAAAHND
jgi:hypothetical protein